jgi:hypothetical protein
MTLNRDVATFAKSPYRVNHSAIAGVNAFGTISKVDRDNDVGTPMPPSGVEAALTDRFDNRTYYG